MVEGVKAPDRVMGYCDVNTAGPIAREKAWDSVANEQTKAELEELWRFLTRVRDIGTASSL